MVRATDQETTAIEKIMYYILQSQKGVRVLSGQVKRGGGAGIHLKAERERAWLGKSFYCGFSQKERRRQGR